LNRIKKPVICNEALNQVSEKLCLDFLSLWPAQSKSVFSDSRKWTDVFPISGRLRICWLFQKIKESLFPSILPKILIMKGINLSFSETKIRNDFLPFPKTTRDMIFAEYHFEWKLRRASLTLMPFDFGISLNVSRFPIY
jgi:hypothetical protein